MNCLRLAFPKSLSHIFLPDLCESLQFKITIEFYDALHEIKIDADLGVLVIGLFETHYAEWNERLPEAWFIVLEEKNAPPIEFAEGHRVLAWISPNISLRRWKFVLSDQLKKFEKLTHLEQVSKTLEYQQLELNQLNEIGVALSSEKNLKNLLDLIVINSMELTYADGGSVYLIEDIPDTEEDPQDYFKNKRFRFEVAKNESREIPFHSFVLEISKASIYGYVALTGKPLLIEDAYFIDPEMEYSWGGRAFDQSINYRTKSILTVPMFNHTDTIIGVIQLINCKKVPHAHLENPETILEQVKPFNQQHIQAIQSVASQAGVAIQNKRLINSIQILFDGFINASVKAIESRDPTTSGHSSRVAALTMGLAEGVNFCQTGRFAQVHFSADQMQEIRYASLLHDFGKIAVQEQVLLKSKKLYPYEQQVVTDRFKLIRKDLELQTTQAQLKYFLEKSYDEALEYAEKSNQALAEKLAEIDACLKFIIRCNEPTVLAQEGFEKLSKINSLNILPGQNSPPLLQPHEIMSLSVPKGSLNDRDRLEIESHVSHTYKFLSIIPWTKSLKDVAKIAYAHHEKLDGSGYPLRLKSEEIPLQSKMMAIADIYDALTAWDRPYKKALPAERALNILEYEAKDNHIDGELLQLFIDMKLYQLVARPVS